jgi:hypothetical protein
VLVMFLGANCRLQIHSAHQLIHSCVRIRCGIVQCAPARRSGDAAGNSPDGRR